MRVGLPTKGLNIMPLSVMGGPSNRYKSYGLSMCFWRSGYDENRYA